MKRHIKLAVLLSTLLNRSVHLYVGEVSMGDQKYQSHPFTPSPTHPFTPPLSTPNLTLLPNQTPSTILPTYFLTSNSNYIYNPPNHPLSPTQPPPFTHPTAPLSPTHHPLSPTHHPLSPTQPPPFTHPTTHPATFSMAVMYEAMWRRRGVLGGGVLRWMFACVTKRRMASNEALVLRLSGGGGFG